MKQAKSHAGDWLALQQTIVAANLVRDALHLLLDNVRVADNGGDSADDTYSAASPFLLRQVLHEFSAELSLLSSTIDAVIDWEASRDANGRTAVRPGVEQTLDEYR